MIILARPVAYGGNAARYAMEKAVSYTHLNNGYQKPNGYYHQNGNK